MEDTNFAANECPTEATMDSHFSVDCVLVGFDGEHLCVLLVRQIGAELQQGEIEFKLPGSLLFRNEEFDHAASRVVTELTGLKNVPLHQFHTFGSPNRIHEPKDLKWMTDYYSLHTSVERVISVAYTSLLKIERRHLRLSEKYEACWVPVNEVGNLAFDHNDILNAALLYIRNQASIQVDIVFRLLPRKFTAAQLRCLFQVIYNQEFDIRNFHKRIAKMDYVVPLDEKETNVAHRAARYYKFDSHAKSLKYSNSESSQ